MKTLTWLQHVNNLAAVSVHEDTWLTSRSRAAEMERQTVAIASTLREGGVEPLRKLNAKVSIVGLLSGQSAEVKTWRKMNFLPSVAADNRRQLLRQVSYFAESRPYLRYLVFTNGPRCHVGELRERLRALHRTISNLAADPMLKHWGITIELRVSELTCERDDEGRWTYHPHANVVIDCSRALRDEWTDFLSFVRAANSAWWKDCGRLVSADEAVKYFTKPAEVLAHTPAEAVDLLRATFLLKMAQPMGALKRQAEEMRDRKTDAGEPAPVKLGKRLSARGWKWCFVRVNRRAQKDGNAGGTAVDQILTVLPPQPRFEPFMEPCAIVVNFSGNLRGLLAKNELSQPIAAAAEKWSARSAPLMSTPTPQLPKAKPAACGANPAGTPSLALSG